MTRYYLYCSQSASSPFQQVCPAQSSPHPAPSAPQWSAAALTVRWRCLAVCFFGVPCKGALGQLAWPSITLDAGVHAEVVLKAGAGPRFYISHKLPDKAVPAGHLE